MTLHPNVGSPQGAFLDLPSGRVTIDPHGDGGRYYDHRFSRWLPVDASAVSQDESHYANGGATVDGKPILHIVDVASRADHVYSLPAELTPGIGGILVFEYSTDVVYLGLDGEGGALALWTFDIAKGTTAYSEISGIGTIHDRVAWRSTFNKSDPSPLSFAPGTPTNQIERLDLRDGTSEVWLYRPGHLVGVLGVDAANEPIVLEYTDRRNLVVSILSSPTSQVVVYAGSPDTWGGFIAGVTADSHGVWFGGDKGIYLYSAHDLKRVTDQPGIPAGTCA